MRKFRSRRVAVRKKRDLVWTTVVVQQILAENASSNSFCSPGLWEANANNFDRATLLRIVGWVGIQQNAAATAGAAVGFAITKEPLTYSAGDFDALITADYDTHDVLWTDGGALGESSTGPNFQTISRIPIDIRVKRKMDSSEQLLFHGSMTVDATATPEVRVYALLRCLIDRS